MQLSECFVERLRHDGEFILYRGRAKRAVPTSMRLVVPVAARPGPETSTRTNALHAGGIAFLKNPFDDGTLLDTLERSIR